MSNEEKLPTQIKPPWPHAPIHQLTNIGVYFVTSGTYLKKHYFNTAVKLDFLHNELLFTCDKFGWQLEAWAVFSNHYHFVARSPERAYDTNLLAKLIAHLHEKTAKWINRIDGANGRKIWHNFWETRLTYERSYFARLKYTHQNAVKHGLVPVANQYSWCSASWFEQVATPAQVNTIYRFKVDRINVPDDYDAVVEG